MTKKIKLTAEILKQLKVSNIIYAEYAEGGAMGNTGGLIICILQTNELIYYETNVYDNEQLYKDASLKIESQSNASFNKNKKSTILFDYHYGGFGNHTFLNTNFKIGRTEDALLFKKGDASFEVRCSNPGVFGYIEGSIKFKEKDKFINNLNSQLQSNGLKEMETMSEAIKKIANKIEANPERLKDNRDAVRIKYGDRLKELIKIINKNDPVDLIVIGCPEDEYEPEARTIIVQLNSNQTKDEIQTIIHKEFIKWFSSDLAGKRENYFDLAKDVYDWMKSGNFLNFNN